MVHTNATARANGTLLDTAASHVGQAFLDQDLVNSVEKLSPYSTNTQAQTTNAQDNILAQEAATSDPFVEYVYLGSQLSDGLLGWLSFGIDPTKSRTVSAAANYYATGGVTNPGGGGGGPGGRPPKE
jgi:hypothetical protein